MDKGSIFWNAFGSALGGFVGVLIFFGIRLLIAWRRNRPIHLKDYLCGNNLNTGTKNETEGEMMHSYGK